MRKSSSVHGIIAVCALCLIASRQCTAAGNRQQQQQPGMIEDGGSEPGVGASTAVGQSSSDQQTAFAEVSKNLTASVDRLSEMILILSSTLNQSIGTSLVREMST